MSSSQVLDRMLVAEVIQHERAARDAGLWAEMAACWHPESTVDVSWFKGDGAAFTGASEKNAAGQTLSFHQMGPSVVTVREGRAIAETGCAVHGMRMLGGAEVAVISHTRLLSRALRVGRDWLLAGLRIVYIRDLLLPRDPTRIPTLGAADLSRYRPSYQFLSYILAQSGHVPRTDLPGVDRPDSVSELRAAERAWLDGA